MAFPVYPVLAQENASSGPITQEDIDNFISVYGSDDPPAAMSKANGSINGDRLQLVTRRLSSVYILRGQNTDNATLLKKLAEISAPNSVNHEEYALYDANDEHLKPVFAKYLGAYTLRLPDSLAEQSVKNRADKATAESAPQEVSLESGLIPEGGPGLAPGLGQDTGQTNSAAQTEPAQPTELAEGTGAVTPEGSAEPTVSVPAPAGAEKELTSEGEISAENLPSLELGADFGTPATN
ncbi:MAG: hypothetical protein LBJ61_08985 [Deltaproteobacteria bacterium]|nr:hypothetical protein [Deltaproteobacteria bacterium]